MMKDSMSLSCLFIFLHFLFVDSDSPLAPALYVFGDSLVDSGNNNLLPTLAKANYLPYGVNFVKGPTGRFTNGRTIADFLAEFLGLPFSPPYMSFRHSVTLTGLNYASGSCGILPKTGSLLGKCLNLDEQIDLFHRTVEWELAGHFETSKQLSEYLSRSIFVFSIGSNDYINNYLESDVFDTSKRYAPQPFAQLLINTLSRRFMRLYRLGARKIVMFEIGPIGCIPSITRKLKPSGGCVEEINQLASYFNDGLRAMQKNLTSTLQNLTFILGLVNRRGYDAIKNPSYYGLTDTTNPCCTTWLNGTSACIPGRVPCPDTEKHFFWDAYHLSEAVCSLIGTRCFNDSSVCFPLNIKELVQVYK